MKMPDKIENSMLAPCGINCKTCYKHCYSKKPCSGCLVNDIGKPEHCRKCKRKECAEANGYTYCYECEKFPCKLIKSLEKSYNDRYGISIVANSIKVKEQGLDAFMEKERIKWTCPLCGGIISQHDMECSECKEKITVAKLGNSHPLYQAQKLFQENNVPFELIYHDNPIRTAQEGSRYFGIAIGQTAPTLIIKTDKGFFALIVSGDRGHVDFDEVASALGCSKVKLAGAREVEKATGWT